MPGTEIRFFARRRAIALAAVIAALAGSTAIAGSARVQTTLAPACRADATTRVVSLNPLRIEARVHQVCNTTHALNVSYQPQTLTGLLQISLEGQAPDVSLPGSASFTNLPNMDSVKQLRISYAGPRDERREIAQTVQIGVSY